MNKQQLPQQLPPLPAGIDYSRLDTYDRAVLKTLKNDIQVQLSYVKQAVEEIRGKNNGFLPSKAWHEYMAWRSERAAILTKIDAVFVTEREQAQKSWDAQGPDDARVRNIVAEMLTDLILDSEDVPSDAELIEYAKQVATAAQSAYRIVDRVLLKNVGKP